ncbi:hypothetical protein I0C86_23845 [Plantactinospora sp. S1510]|uniref:Uncharacterized protein n=1 Tax=Plantactinospora alkalitolerans TaxID=2789879 RepID=A0ABS0H0J0_9ACTN|nr:DUF6069 family protein [Plantactinospora alkalitolerans]MBF9131974.1 hypothetical protein [Plantactinospora alkalitolerans]
MTDVGTAQATARPPARARTNAGRPALVAAALAGLLIINLAIYAVGRALGGAFTYPQNGTTTQVDWVSITFMSLVPLGFGLTLVAVLSRKWPKVIPIARVVAPVLAVATIAVMTIPAGFDTTSTVALSAMHLTIIPAALLALRGLPHRRRGSTRHTPPN